MPLQQSFFPESAIYRLCAAIRVPEQELILWQESVTCLLLSGFFPCYLSILTHCSHASLYTDWVIGLCSNLSSMKRFLLSKRDGEKDVPPKQIGGCRSQKVSAWSKRMSSCDVLSDLVIYSFTEQPHSKARHQKPSFHPNAAQIVNEFPENLPKKMQINPGFHSLLLSEY